MKKGENIENIEKNKVKFSFKINIYMTLNVCESHIISQDHFHSL